MSGFTIWGSAVVRAILSFFSRKKSWPYPTPKPALAKGLDFSGISEFRGDVFPESGQSNWLDASNALAEIDRRQKAREISAEEADACRFWHENGYWVAPSLFADEELDFVWGAYEEALASGILGERHAVSPDGRLFDRKLDPALLVPEIKALQHHAKLMRWTDLFLGRKTMPFQTIMGHAGSQQAAHSDSIHMTTYPFGFMVANWTAFEEIEPDSGPLIYYPGSHRLPYLLSREIGIAPGEFKQHGYRLYHERYEPVIAELCVKHGFEQKTFLAKKGDTLFWHANLVHGGSPRTNPNRSRKALVCHHFADGVVSYHDLSGNLTRIHLNA